MAPELKKAKTEESEPAEKAGEEAEKGAVEEAKDKGPPPELEQDAPLAKGVKIKEPATFLTQDTTMNCIASGFGNMLMPLTDGGLQFLLAGARCNVGLKAGRYLFEAKVVEFMNPAEDPTARQRSPLPRNQLRVGVAAAVASAFLGDGELSACFDAEGAFIHNGKKQVCSQRFGQGDVVGVLVNLDAQSPNANTISMFKNGKRASQPQPLPDTLKGKPLFPAFTFRNVTVHYNFGPKPLAPLPFTCHMVKDALAKEAAVTAPEKDGTREVLFPVCLPDEGTFDWLDLQQGDKRYTELSDRAVLKWAEKSGFSLPKATGKSSNDKPEAAFGIPMMDDGSVRRVLHAVAPVQARNYVVMEVKGNLLKEERKELAAKWAGTGFKRTAAVMMGEPPADFKKKSQALALKLKQEASDADFRAKQAEVKRKKAQEKRQKQLERERKKAAKLAKKKQEALKKKLEEEKKKKLRAEKGEEAEVEESKEEEAEEEKESEEEQEEEEMEVDEEPPKVELTADERGRWFRKTPVPDMSPFALSTSFTKFSIPEQEEGFDQVRFDWVKGDKCKEYLKQWVRDRKLTTRIEDLEPSEWFNNRWKDWQKALQAWHAKQNQHKAAVAKKTAEAAAKAAKQKAEAEKAAAAKAKAEKEKAEKEKAAEEGGEAQGDGQKEESAKEDAEAAAPPEEEKEEKEEPTVDFDKLDVFSVEDVLDIGGGRPLFSQFAYEDWTMLSLRFEVYILVHAFRRDANDPDRVGIHLDHLLFYYSKYFKKALTPKTFGADSVKDLLDLIKDTAVVDGKNQVVRTVLPEDMESFGVFAMITEAARRYRNRRVSLGDESAALKLTQQVAVAGAGAVSGPRPVVSGPRPVTPVAGARPVVVGGPRPVGAMTVPAVRPAGAVGWQRNGAGVSPAARPAWWGYGH